jgi:hypothetical protein
MTTDERRELIERYARGPQHLKEAFEAVPAEARQWRPAPGKWSPHEIVCHCADAETNAAMRIRYVVAEKDPVIIGYDQDVWAREFDYHAHPVEVAMATLFAVREHTTALLRRLPEAAWGKIGRHSESGRYTAQDWLRIYAEHVDNHAGQIRRVAEAWGK